MADCARVRRGLLFGALCAVNFTASAQSVDYRFVRSDDPVADRNAYVLTLIMADPVVRKALAQQADLTKIGQRLDTTRKSVIAACTERRITSVFVCPIDQLELTDVEIRQAAEALARLAGPNGALNGLVRDRMRASGLYQKYAHLQDKPFMSAAWTATAHAINRLYRIYGLGESFALSVIDGMSRNPADDDYRSLLAATLQASIDSASGEPFFAIWSRVGFDLLAINQRDEAGRYEPLDTGENAAALVNARGLNWRSARYSAIVVPGAGLQPGEVQVSPIALLEVRIAAKRWHEGLAPFIIVSGGHVWPNRTPYAEAIEMKKMLRNRYGIPENAIFVDPYARHTTTNLRNASRLLFRMRAPMDKPVVIIRQLGALDYILGEEFAVRCDQELGYQPMAQIAELSTFELTAQPNILSLHADPSDPLDP